LQGGVDAYDALSRRSLSAKEPLIAGLFCGKWPTKIRHPMHLCHPISCVSCIYQIWCILFIDVGLQTARLTHEEILKTFTLTAMYVIYIPHVHCINANGNSESCTWISLYVVYIISMRRYMYVVYNRSMRTYMYYKCAYICVYIHICTQMFASREPTKCVCLYVYMFIYNICMYICIYITSVCIFNFCVHIQHLCAHQHL